MEIVSSDYYYFHTLKYIKDVVFLLAVLNSLFLFKALKI